MKPKVTSNENATNAQLHSLVEASNLLNSSLNLKKILVILLDIATKDSNADRGTIYLVDKERNEIWSQVAKGNEIKEIRLKIGQGIAGTVAKTGKTINLKDVYKDKRFDRDFDKRSGYKTNTMLCCAMKDKNDNIVGVFQILNKKIGVFTIEDEIFLTALSIPATLAIENARLHETEVQVQRMERELEVAAQIQRQILPTSLPLVEGIQLAGSSSPCHAVGGDYYDVYKIDNHRVALIVGDVSGKGIPAALLVSTLQAFLHAYKELNFQLRELATKLNDSIFQKSTAEKYITFVICIFDLKTSMLYCVNAGHCFPLIVRADGTIIELKNNGFALGMLPNSKYEEESIQLSHGDILMLYSDGISEAMDKKQRLYGTERLAKRVKQFRGFTTSEIMGEVFNDVKKYSDNKSQDDDLTMVLMKVG